MHPEREAAVIPEQEDTLKKDIHDAVELIKSLSLNWVEFGGRGRGRGIMGRKVEGALDAEASPGGIGRGREYPSSVKCWNCEEWGHISPQCDKPVRLGGDMYPIMHRENDRLGDYEVEVKEASKPSPSKSVSWEDKEKGKAVSLIDAKKIPEVMPVAKRTWSANGKASPSAKKGNHPQLISAHNQRRRNKNPEESIKQQI